MFVPREVTMGAPRMAARSCKETADVWQCSDEKRGCSPCTKREHTHLLLSSSLHARTPACQVRLSIVRWSRYWSESLTCLVPCKSSRPHLVLEPSQDKVGGTAVL